MSKYVITRKDKDVVSINGVVRTSMPIAEIHAFKERLSEYIKHCLMNGLISQESLIELIHSDGTIVSESNSVTKTWYL